MYTKLSSVSCRLVLSANLESLSQTNLWCTRSFDSKMIKSRAGLQKLVGHLVAHLIVVLLQIPSIPVATMVSSREN